MARAANIRIANVLHDDGSGLTKENLKKRLEMTEKQVKLEEKSSWWVLLLTIIPIIGSLIIAIVDAGPNRMVNVIISGVFGGTGVVTVAVNNIKDVNSRMTVYKQWLLSIKGELLTCNEGETKCLENVNRRINELEKALRA